MDFLLGFFVVFLIISLLWRVLKLLISLTFSVFTGIALFTLIGIILMLFK